MFIVFEGVDGCGKSTQIKKTAQYLKNHNHELVVTREPGGTIAGELIREIFLHTDFNTELQYLLMLASRAEHIDSVILPALKANKIVICDRYCDSTIIYQPTINQDLPWIGSKITQDILPDIVFLLDIDAELAFERINQRAKKDLFENKATIDIIAKRREGYLKLAKENASRYYVLDGTKEEDKIQEEIINYLEKKLHAQ